MARVIGIDLGTSNSAAAVMEGGRPTIIPSAEGAGVSSGKAFPSFVAFTKEGDRLVGEPARRQAAINPDGTIYAAKRKMGTDHKFKLFGKEYSPQQISAFISAEDQAGCGSVPRGHRGGGGHHLPRVFRRQPAHGHQGRRRDRRPESAAHHQRAHRGVSCLRPGEGGQGAEDPRVRLRRRNARRHHHGDVEGGRVQGRGHQRGHPAGRHGHGQRLRGLRGEGVHAPDRHRPQERHHGHAEGAGSRGESEGGAFQHHVTRTSTCRSSRRTPAAPSTSP